MPPKKKKLLPPGKSQFNTAPFDYDVSEEEGPDIRYKNNPFHREMPGNVFASRRIRLARLVMFPFDSSSSRVG